MTRVNETPSAPAAATVKDDANGQFAPVQSGSHNNGAASAEPRVLGDGEATASDWNKDAEDDRDRPVSARRKRH